MIFSRFRFFKHIYHSFSEPKFLKDFQNFSDSNAIMKQIKAKIECTGPITIATYMREALTTPLEGYYMKKDVFGEAGDFITSPEISQMFGELIGVWFCNEWLKVGRPSPVQFVEFGPGRGTLADDVLRVFCKVLQPYNVQLSIHLIEVSPQMKRIQKSKLCNSQELAKGADDKHFITKHGFNLSFHENLASVPEGFSLFLAHEFFDALPIHKFQKVKDGWKEVLIDFKDQQLRFVLSRNTTPATNFFIDPNESRSHVEVCPEAGVIVQEICKRMKEDGGITLIADYGHDGTKSDTFRGFKNHQLCNPLENPGNADLTADVDFSYLRKCIDNEGYVFGPVSQSYFLTNMGIEIRLQTLLQNSEPNIQESLKSGCEMLVNPEKMGDRFKFFAIFPNVLETILKKFPPAGF